MYFCWDDCVTSLLPPNLPGSSSPVALYLEAEETFRKATWKNDLQKQYFNHIYPSVYLAEICKFEYDLCVYIEFYRSIPYVSIYLSIYMYSSIFLPLYLSVCKYVYIQTIKHTNGDFILQQLFKHVVRKGPWAPASPPW